MARALAQRGLRTGDRVALVTGPTAATLNVVLGALRTGIIPVVINRALLPAERQALLADADPQLVLDDAMADALTNEEAPATAASRPVELAPWPLGRPMHFTSGTTGAPKGVWSGVLSESAAAKLLGEERDLWRFERGDTYLAFSPMHHSAPLRFAIGVLMAGGSVVLPGAFDARRQLSLVAAARPTVSFCVPAHLQRLRALGVPAAEMVLAFSSYRLLAHAGAPCPDALKRWIVGVLPDGAVWEFYGSTEGQFTACSTEEWSERPGTVGRARPGRALRTADDGTLWCRTPPHARFTYWRAPEKTAAAWRGDEFTVGDVGRVDADGYVFLEGRRDDLVISGGVNVYPAEVERVVLAMVGVSEAAVFGRDDERWGQRVCLAVVGDGLDAAAIEAWCRERLAAYKVPKEVHVVAELPRTSTGKVRRSTLAEDLGLTPG